MSYTHTDLWRATCAALLILLATAHAGAGPSPGSLASPEPYRYLADITGISRQARRDGEQDYGRIAGSEYDRMAADFVESTFSRLGLSSVRQERFENHEPTWRLASSELSFVSDDGDVIAMKSAFTPYFAKTTGETPFELDVVEIGSLEDARHADLAGKAVLLHAHTRGIVFRHAAQPIAAALAKQGQVGAIIIAVHQPGNPQTRYAISGGGGARDLENVAWVNISGADGEKLSRLIGESGSPRIRLRVDGTIEPVSHSQNTFGILPGRSSRAFLFIAHTDSHFQGASDNASGLAALLALAENFASRSGTLERDLVFVATGAHHNGPAGGVRHLIANHPKLVDRIDLVVNLEHFASRNQLPGGRISDHIAPTTLFVPAQNPAIVASIRAAAERHGVNIGEEVRAFWSGDYAPFLSVGTPAVMLMQPTPWYHTEADTMETISPDALAAVLATYTDFIRDMDALSTAAIAEGVPTRDLLRDLIRRQREANSAAASTSFRSDE